MAFSLQATDQTIEYRQDLVSISSPLLDLPEEALDQGSMLMFNLVCTIQRLESRAKGLLPFRICQLRDEQESNRKSKQTDSG